MGCSSGMVPRNLPQLLRRIWPEAQVFSCAYFEQNVDKFAHTRTYMQTYLSLQENNVSQAWCARSWYSSFFIQRSGGRSVSVTRTLDQLAYYHKINKCEWKSYVYTCAPAKAVGVAGDVAAWSCMICIPGGARVEAKCRCQLERFLDNFAQHLAQVDQGGKRPETWWRIWQPNISVWLCISKSINVYKSSQWKIRALCLYSTIHWELPAHTRALIQPQIAHETPNALRESCMVRVMWIQGCKFVWSIYSLFLFWFLVT